MMGSLVIVMDDRRVLDHREGGGGIRQSKLVVRVERNLLLMRNGGHVLRMRPQVHRLTGFRHQIHDVFRWWRGRELSFVRDANTMYDAMEEVDSKNSHA